MVNFIAGALIMLSGVYFGLKWQSQLRQGQTPTLPKLKPTQRQTEGTLPDLTPEVITEWFEGEQKEGEG